MQQWMIHTGRQPGQNVQLIDKSDQALVSECYLSYVPMLHVNTWASSHHYALHSAKLHMHAHCISMCEPVNAVVVKISFNGESRAMIYGSCVKLLDIFDSRAHEKASYKFFFSKNFWWFFFNFIDFLMVVPVVAEEKQGHIQNQH